MCRLPGKAYAKRQHVWLTGANEVDSKVFSRAILAKVCYRRILYVRLNCMNLCRKSNGIWAKHDVS